MSIIVIECRHGMPDFLCRRCHPELNSSGNQPFAASAAPAPSAKPRDFYQPKGMSDAEWEAISAEREAEQRRKTHERLVKAGFIKEDAA